MKKLTLLIILHFSFLTFHSSAQLPNFTLVDTGAIYEFSANQLHLSGIVFDADNDGDFDPVIGDSSEDPDQLVLYKNERNGLYKLETFLPETTNAFPITFTSPTGDIDNDGDSDVIGQKKWDGQLSVFFNDGFGNFASDTIYSMPSTPYSPYPVLLDFNGDGFLDLIRFDTAVVVLYNNGEGIFSNKTTIGHYDQGNNIVQHSLSWADVNNDGYMDVYCGMTYHKNIFFLNTGTALEQVEEDHITLIEDEATPCVNWIDYDNDCDMDLYTGDALFENLGSMEFEKHIIRDEKYDSDSVWSSSRVWGDLDNDGDLDLFISVENNHLLGNLNEPLSSHPYNLLYMNEGNGNFTNVLNHGLTLDDSHTAEIFDHDNDGDLDVLTIGNAWARNGRNMLYVNEGNDNSSILVNCVDRYGCATPYGTRIYAKTMINGEYVSQTREVTPVDGNLSFANTRIHFGLGNADVIDTLLICWPSGHVDEYLDVKANQFYRAIEDSTLLIDFKATNYIQYSPGIADINFEEIGENTSIDLKQHYHFIKGDTVPEITGDTLTFSVYNNENPEVVTVELNGSILTLESGSVSGDSKVQIIASAGFTKRMDQFTVKQTVGYATIASAEHSLIIYPNPCSGAMHLRYQINDKGYLISDLFSISGIKIKRLLNEEKMPGEYELEVDLTGLPSGVYFMKFVAGDQVVTKKLIIK